MFKNVFLNNEFYNTLDRLFIKRVLSPTKLSYESSLSLRHIPIFFRMKGYDDDSRSVDVFMGNLPQFRQSRNGK